MVVGHERDSKPVIVHPQITICATRHSIRPHRLHFLGEQANIGLAITEILEAIVTESIFETSQLDDVVL